MLGKENAQCLTIYLRSGDQHAGQPLYRLLLRQARQAKLAGLTVCKGIIGYGPHGAAADARCSVQRSDHPLIMHVVDRPERLQQFLSLAGELLASLLVTVEDIHVVSAEGATSRFAL